MSAEELLGDQAATPRERGEQLRREAIAELFRHFPREATPERLDAMVNHTRRVPAVHMAETVAAVLEGWKLVRAPVPHALVEAWHKKVAPRIAAVRASRGRDPEAPTSVVDPEATEAFLARARAVYDEGRYVPNDSFDGRLLAAMYVHHETGKRWNGPDLTPDRLRHFDDVLIAFEHAHEGRAEVNWWSDFTEAHGWRPECRNPARGLATPKARGGAF